MTAAADPGPRGAPPQAAPAPRFTVPAPLFWANAALLLLWPVAWAAPLLHTGLLPFLGEDVSILSGLASLWEADILLALIVGLLGVLMPLVKTLALAAVHTARLGPAAMPALEILGKLAMADVFLLALTVVIAKGVGVGRVETAWGLPLFAALVLGGMLLSHLTKKRLRSAS